MRTMHDLAAENIVVLQDRYDTLIAKRLQTLLGKPGLTAEEHLELIALGEAIALYYRHPAQIHWAVQAGASWPAIADALGTDEAGARRAYASWAHAQHRTGGMDTAAYAAAVAAVKTSAMDSLQRSAGLIGRINTPATELDRVELGDRVAGHRWGPDHA
jgi:hypothetical protein